MSSLYENLPKYTVGTELRDSSREILKLIIKANSMKEKREMLLKIRGEIEDRLIQTRKPNRGENA